MLRNKQALVILAEALLLIALLSYRPTLWSVTGALGVLGCAFGVGLMVTRRRLAVFNVLVMMVLWLWLLSEAKRHFWKERLQAGDLKVLCDPQNFETLKHYPLWAAGALLLTLFLIALACLGFRFRETRVKTKKAVIVGLLIAAVGAETADLAEDHGQRQWLESLPKGTNVVSNILMSADIRFENPAQHWDLAGAEPFVFAGPAAPAPDAARPDVVLLLQESTADPSLFTGVEPGSLPALAMFDTNRVSTGGLLRVHTWGGGTWKSEFSVLTGLSSADFTPLDNAVFYDAVFHVKDSLFHRLKAAGYRVVVITPFVQGAYNSGNAYKALGADQVIHVCELGYPGSASSNIWHIRTGDLLALVKTYLETRDDKTPTAVYALTMREHGPYLTDVAGAPALKAQAGSGVSAKRLSQFADYVGRLAEASDDVTAFEGWVRERKTPTVFLRFGDHQPGINWNGGYKTTFGEPAYLTYWALTDNRMQGQVAADPVTDIVFLPEILLSHLPGVDPGERFAAAREMRQRAGGLYEDCPDSRLLKSYRKALYGPLKAVE